MAKTPRFAFGRSIAPARFLLFAAIFLILSGGAAWFGVHPRSALLAGFDVATLVFLVTCLPLLQSSVVQMRRRSADNDANRAGLLAISVLLSLIVLFAVGTLIASPGPLGHMDIALIVATLILSWLFANTVFTLHYAHLYYLQKDACDQAGLDVPGMKQPGYWDFLYFSFTLGMTFQTSDVTISGAHMRRVVLGHCMAAFVFNMGILAFTVNALGGS
ncbi:DUF1345 domain-containing protein [Sphingopyxis sp.]|uniref:DUF1345 domain-containing protein n=1 Tax=Sphingopyxis sp. TaxID=1908224 RepID=UPI0035AE9042